MRALLALLLTVGVAAPASAGTWEPRQSLSHSRQVAVGPDGSTLLGWVVGDDGAETHEVRYARVADDGSLGPEMLVASRPPHSAELGLRHVLSYPTLFDSRGNATLIWSFDDESDTYCCHRYETALLPRGAEAPIAHQQIEPPGRDRSGLQLAVGPTGERVGAWVIDRPYGAASLIQVLDAPPGQGFAPPETIADERVQLAHGEVHLRVLVERDGTAWVFWATEEERDERTVTAVRAARRSSGARRWRIRTLARLAARDHDGFQTLDWGLQAVSGGDDELLVGWKECDNHGGGSRCRIKSRWRHSGSWGRARIVHGGDSFGELRGGWGLAMDRRGRAMIVFDTCVADPDGYSRGNCTLRMATGRRGDLGEVRPLGPGWGPVLAASDTGQVALFSFRGLFRNPDPARQARLGTIATGFGRAEPIDDGYSSTLNAVGIDNRGNLAATFLGFDPGTDLLRYRR